MLSEQAAGWGIKTGFFFGILTAIGGILMYFLVPEVSLSRTFNETYNLSPLSEFRCHYHTYADVVV